MDKPKPKTKLKPHQMMQDRHSIFHIVPTQKNAAVHSDPMPYSGKSADTNAQDLPNE